MPVYDTYSKRKARESGGQLDVFQYTSIPAGLRTQILQIWDDAFGVPYYNPQNDRLADKIHEAYHAIAGVLRREFSVMTLSGLGVDRHSKSQSFGDLREWFAAEKNTDKLLDAIEVSFRLIDRHTRKFEYINRQKADAIATEAIDELNVRFKEHGVGYQFAGGSIIRLDSTLIHQEAVLPALSVLRGTEFKNAQEEFLGAYEHYRHGAHEEALVEACKAFESTMKVICQKRGWPFDPNRSTVSELIRTCMENGLIPPYWENHFSGLRTMLTSGIPTARNRQGGHGAGTAENNEPPAQLVSYVLHMTASTILFLAESEKALPPSPSAP
jgi:hypothetical protein